MCSDEEAGGSATGSPMIENARTRVTEWRFPKKGDNTGWHVHEYDYVVVPLLDGQLELHEPGGTTKFADLRKGVPYFRQKGVRHDVLNPNDFEFAFLEIEFLDDAGA
ncbi:cupin domain-containing protein [Citreimonas sp.]|uniref:cupin domain-containing protein n=1 Tax=Citreimonas sp. TaxID=3036715 RepID=UPI0035C831D4